MVLIVFDVKHPVDEQLIGLRPFLDEIHLILLPCQLCFPIILALVDGAEEWVEILLILAVERSQEDWDLLED